MQTAREGDKMDAVTNKRLTDEQIRAINEALAAKMRVEIVSTADGVKIYHVRRKELNY